MQVFVINFEGDLGTWLDSLRTSEQILLDEFFFFSTPGAFHVFQKFSVFGFGWTEIQTHDFVDFSVDCGLLTFFRQDFELKKAFLRKLKSLGLENERSAFRKNSSR